MIRKLPYAEWIAAQRELAVIREEAKTVNMPTLEPMLMRAQKYLVIEKNPAVAGSELELTADQLKAYPQLQESISKLSQKIIEFPFAESEHAS